MRNSLLVMSFMTLAAGCAKGGDSDSDAAVADASTVIDGAAGDGRVIDGAMSMADASVDGAAGSCVGPPDRDLEPNNGPVSASPIPSQLNFRLPNLGICSAGDIDYFTVTVGAGAHINAKIDFTHASGDLNLALLDSAATQLRNSDSSGAAQPFETVDATGLAAGKYYLRVAGKDSGTTTGYGLTVSVN